MVRLNHYLTGPQVEALHALAERTGLSLAELVRRAVDAYLKAEGVAPGCRPVKEEE
jgi:hypothetical protein